MSTMSIKFFRPLLLDHDQIVNGIHDALNALLGFYQFIEFIDSHRQGIADNKAIDDTAQFFTQVLALLVPDGHIDLS
jgi:hypothetical protein